MKGWVGWELLARSLAGSLLVVVRSMAVLGWNGFDDRVADWCHWC